MPLYNSGHDQFVFKSANGHQFSCVLCALWSVLLVSLPYKYALTAPHMICYREQEFHQSEIISL